MPSLEPFPADAPPWLRPWVHVLQGGFLALCAVLVLPWWAMGWLLVGVEPELRVLLPLGAAGLAGLIVVAARLPRLDRDWLVACAIALGCGFASAVAWILFEQVQEGDGSGWIVILSPALVGGAVALVEVASCLAHRRRLEGAAA